MSLKCLESTDQLMLLSERESNQIALSQSMSIWLWQIGTKNELTKILLVVETGKVKHISTSCFSMTQRTIARLPKSTLASYSGAITILRRFIKWKNAVWHFQQENATSLKSIKFAVHLRWWTPTNSTQNWIIKEWIYYKSGAVGYCSDRRVKFVPQIIGGYAFAYLSDQKCQSLNGESGTI